MYVIGSGTYRQNWQHVYTAVTRGRKNVFIIGQEIHLRKAVTRPEVKRQTSLKKQLIQMFQVYNLFLTTSLTQKLFRFRKQLERRPLNSSFSFRLT